MADSKKIIKMKMERANLTTSIRAIMNEFEGKAMEQIKKDELEKIEALFDALNGDITKEEKQLERERLIGEVKNLEDKTGSGRIGEIRAAFNDYITSGSADAYKIYNALQQDNPTQAGYLTAPEQFVFEVIEELKNNTFMRQKANVLAPLKGSRSLGYPTRTAGMSSFAWGTEIAAATADTTLAYGKREFKPNPATSKLLLSETLVRNVPGSDTLVRNEIGREITEGLETAYMTGDGAGKPLGLFTASANGIPVARDVSTGNTTTEIKFDGLINAKMSIKQQYRRNAEWIFSREAISQVMKLKDSSGQYIWQQSVIAGQPDRLLGDSVNETEFAPNTFTTGLYVGIYGDLKNYWICDSLAMEIRVLNELYAETFQVGYRTRIETDGAPVMAVAFARVKLG